MRQQLTADMVKTSPFAQLPRRTQLLVAAASLLVVATPGVLLYAFAGGSSASAASGTVAIRPCASSMQAIVTGHDPTGPPFLFAPATGASSPTAAMQAIATMAAAGLEAACPYIDSTAAAQIAHLDAAAAGGTLSPQAAGVALRGTPGLTSPAVTVGTLHCSANECSAQVTTHTASGGGTPTSAFTVGVIAYDSHWYLAKDSAVSAHARLTVPG